MSSRIVELTSDVCQLFTCWVICHAFLSSDLTFKFNFFEKFFKEHYLGVKLSQDQDLHSVGPDLDPNCLQRLSADDRSGRLI